MKTPNWVVLVFFVLVCEMVGILGSLFTFPSLGGWYKTLQKPPFSPPDSVFGPVWAILYALMAISAYLIWKMGLKKKEVKAAFNIFVFQLFLNGMWTPIFFGMKNIFLAFIVITTLWVLILFTMSGFYKLNKTASYLLAPYFLWVSFAAFLNFTLWRMN